MCVFDPDPSSFLATFASWPPDSLYLSPTAVLFRALNKPNSFPLEIPGICCFFWWEVLRSFSAFLLLTLSYPWISAHTHSLRIFFTVHHDHIHSLWPFSYCFLVLIIRRRQWQPTPVLLPGKSHRRRSLVGCSPWGCRGSDMTEQLHFHFSLLRIGEGNGNPLQCSCLENPRDGGAWWAAVSGVAQSRTWLKLLSSSSSSNPPDGVCISLSFHL